MYLLQRSERAAAERPESQQVVGQRQQDGGSQGWRAEGWRRGKLRGQRVRCRGKAGSPLALAEGVEAELVGDLSGVHGIRKILLVGEHEEDGVAELVLLKGAREFGREAVS